MEIIGYRHYSYEKNGRTYSGYRVWCKDKGYEGVTGETCDSFVVGDSVCEKSKFIPSVGLDIQVSYPKEGKFPNYVFVL